MQMAGARILVVDAGGRGNAIAHAFARSPSVESVFVAPGNAGSSLLQKCSQADGSQIKGIDDMISFAERNRIDLTFVGPEGYLSAGIVDAFEERGLDIVGPERRAALLEGSKCWTKDLLREIGVPVPPYRNFNDPDEAKEFVNQFYDSHPGENLVVKADGLAAGKGSVVCSSREEALSTVERIMVYPRIFGDAGNRIEIESRLNGRELMFFAIADGKNILPLESAMDYKQAFAPDEIAAIRLFNKLSGNPNLDNNPNTGGMGGFSPHPWLDDELREIIMSRIARPTMRRVYDMGLRYRGFIYFGLMIVERDGAREPYVLEINVRLGDPEAEVILPRLRTDMYELSRAVIDQKLNEIELEWIPEYHLGICAVSGRVVKPLSSGSEERPGYPGAHYTNIPIRGLDRVDPDVLVYHNGTAFGDSGKIYTTGGRVLTLVAKGASLSEARSKAYDNIKRIRFNGMRYRRDIGLDYI
ncbi:MAG: phosphoribosylamine--glycine ligase [Methanothrix sp.]|nr:phosphoribosylamine--glycine ligase [Methanothrix sp.]MCX8207229.1 phosphoribosylamine--glycine ligase [Methanothrix sp.]